MRYSRRFQVFRFLVVFLFPTAVWSAIGGMVGGATREPMAGHVLGAALGAFMGLALAFGSRPKLQFPPRLIRAYVADGVFAQALLMARDRDPAIDGGMSKETPTAADTVAEPPTAEQKATDEDAEITRDEARVLAAAMAAGGAGGAAGGALTGGVFAVWYGTEVTAATVLWGVGLGLGLGLGLGIVVGVGVGFYLRSKYREQDDTTD